jgi:hypothetical protein
MLFFPMDAIIVGKTKLLILSTSIINIDWIKTFLVDMDLYYRKNYLKF